MRLSIIIPTSQEKYLENTIEDIKRNAVTDPEILWQEDDGRGQRALCNLLAGKVQGEYIMKTDAHCSFGPGFDEILLRDIKDNEIVAPFLLPLDAERWVVSHHNKMANYVFDTELVMHHAQTERGMIVETMCLQGSCFMTSKRNWFEWGICDETLGSWGGQGVELGISAWNHQGRCVTNKNTYYGHLFRHQAAEFPYQRDEVKIKQGQELLKQKFLNQSIGWLVKKFNYPVDWTPERVANL